MTDAETGKLHLITSKTGRDGSLAINQDTELLLGKFKSGDSVTHTLRPRRHAWVHVAEGNVELNGQPLTGGDGVEVSDEGELRFTGKSDAQLLVFDLN